MSALDEAVEFILPDWFEEDFDYGSRHTSKRCETLSVLSILTDCGLFPASAADVPVFCCCLTDVLL